MAVEVKRGTGEKIHAVIWLCDMRDSTRLSESMPIESFFALEILSYIGDAVFAIFPIGESGKPLPAACTPEEGACTAALAAARDARTRVEALNQTRQQRASRPSNSVWRSTSVM